MSARRPLGPGEPVRVTGGRWAGRRGSVDALVRALGPGSAVPVRLEAHGDRPAEVAVVDPGHLVRRPRRARETAR